MVSLPDLQSAIDQKLPIEYQCRGNLNLYDSPEIRSLATQAVAGRQLRIVPPLEAGQIQGIAIQVCLCEDNYPGWLPLEDIDLIEVAETPYQPVSLTASDIHDRIPQVIEFAQQAMQQPNHYLWGGTVGPNYDCSGLVQTAFAATGIWLPRDSYQQEAFTQPIALDALQPGDLIFFGTPERANHVALYLGEQHYIHSSGREMGRNGIGIDRFGEDGDRIGQAYYRLFRQAGRVVRSYQP